MNSYRRSAFRVLICLAGFLAMAAPLRAESVHEAIPFSKQVGLTVPKTYSFRFSLFDGVNVTSIWSEIKSIKLTGANLKHQLGSVTPFAAAPGGPVDFSQQYWVEVAYLSNGVYKPLGSRTKLTVVPYALYSASGPVGPPGPPIIFNAETNDTSVGADEVKDVVETSVAAEGGKKLLVTAAAQGFNVSWMDPPNVLTSDVLFQVLIGDTVVKGFHWSDPRGTGYDPQIRAIVDSVAGSQTVKLRITNHSYYTNGAVTTPVGTEIFMAFVSVQEF